MSEILTNRCTKYMETKEAKKYKIAEGENLNIAYFNFRIGSLNKKAALIWYSRQHQVYWRGG